MKYILSCVVLVSLSTSSLYAINWAKTFGGTGQDKAYSICEASNGGYIAAGYTNSFGAGYSDFLVIKLNSSGNIVWAKTFGGTEDDWASSICQTSDGGYIVAGNTKSFGAGSVDLLVIKLNSSGDIQWAKRFGRTDDEYAYSICETSDGGYIVAGYTRLSGTDYDDFLVIKLNSSGNIQWAKTFSDTDNDYAYSICETSDGGYIVAGATYFWEDFEFLVIKLNSSGDTMWATRIGDTGDDYAYSICETSDGGCIVAGITKSFGAGVVSDFLVIKLNSSGVPEWVKPFRGISYDYAYSICKTSDGGYIVAGETLSFGAGSYDFLVIKLNSFGNIQWAKTFGGTDWDGAYSICQASDGHYIVAGWTSSFGIGGDFLVLKIEPNGSMGEGCPWYSANPTIPSLTLFTTSPYLTVTSPSISSYNVSPTVTSPNLLSTTICEALGEYDKDTLIESPIIEVYTPYLDVIPLGNNKFYVKYGLPKANKEFSINLSLYNLSGKLERILFSGKKSSGVYKMNLDLNDLPSGIYFLRLSFDSNYFDRKLIIQR